MNDFDKFYVNAIEGFDKELSRLLKRQFLFARDSDGNFASLATVADHPISKRLRQIKTYLDAYNDCKNTGFPSITKDKLHRLFASYFNLKLLVQDLNRVEKHDAMLLDDFTGMLLKSNEDNYYGDRLELQVASFLVGKNIPFTKSESPDFWTTQGGKRIGFECTSVHYKTTKPSDKALHDKIGKAINAKSKKTYAARSLAVFIDITNVHSFSTDADNLLGNPVSLKNYLGNKLRRTNYGSIILFTYVLQSAPSLSWATASRVDAPNADPELLAFLDSSFGPASDFIVIQNAIVPSSV